MAIQTLKQLGQSNPAVNTLTTLYTVPSATSTTVSSVVICNQSSSPSTFRLSTAIAGAADTIAQYLYYNQVIAANSTFVATVGITLATTDVIRVYASNSTMSFIAYGVEVT